MSVIVLVYLLMSSTCAGAKSDGSSVPAYIVWILVACVGGIVLVAAIVLMSSCVFVVDDQTNERLTQTHQTTSQYYIRVFLEWNRSISQSINQEIFNVAKIAISHY